MRESAAQFLDINLNTLLMLLFGGFLWSIRREIRKWDELWKEHRIVQQDITTLMMEVKSHDTLDDQRFADHERWLTRLDERITTQAQH